MKRIALILAAAMLLSVGLWSCEKDNGDDSSTSTATTGGGENPGGGQSSEEWVDLGLPSGLLWATCNVGASSPEEYGNYYAWGETKTKSSYSWDTYAYGSGYFQLTKYNNNSYFGVVDSLTTLQPEDDAATTNMGNGARTPTKEEWQELINCTLSTWTTLNDVYGLKVTAFNGNSLFLPAAGSYNRDGVDSMAVGMVAGYMSSSLFTDGPPYNWCVTSSSYTQLQLIYAHRYVGHPVRAVRSPQKCQ